MQILQFLFTGRLAKACKSIWAWATKQAHHLHKPTTAPKLTMRVMDNRDKSLKRQAKISKQTKKKETIREIFGETNPWEPPFQPTKSQGKTRNKQGTRLATPLSNQ